jgi:glycosyltransferase involved in cell wall biosynthesis
VDILLIAPQPFYSERGTPIAVRAVVETLAQAGHRVDMLTYHQGANVPLPGVRVFRAARPPMVRHVPIGPSWQKAACDARLASAAAALSRWCRYDVLHGVEEGALVAAVLARRRRLPFIYDMDSLMSEQLREKGGPFSAAAGTLAALERWALGQAAGVLAVCPCLVEHARRHAPAGAPVELLPDFPLEGGECAAPDPEVASIEGTKLVYVGNLEHYQGVDLMLRSFAVLAARRREATMVVVGGNEAEVEPYRRDYNALIAAGRVRFLGARPPARLGGLLAAADVLVSPRIKGRNTPMKIYSYLASGKAIIATDLATHTQVLDPSVALLVEPKPGAMAAGMERLVDDSGLRSWLGGTGRALAESTYSRARFGERLLGFYQQIEAQLSRGGSPAPRRVPAAA